MSNPFNRRRFLRNSTCGMMSSIPAINTVLNMSLASNLARAEGPTAPGDEDYKALICLFMNGGNDAFNMLVPTTQSEYDDYELTRSNLSLPKDSLNAAANVKPLTVLNTPGRTFGVHPELGEMAGLFNQGNAAFVANVGTLVEPIPGAIAPDFDSGAYQIPVSLGAHNTAQTHWETGLPQYVTNTTGWLGRTADLLSDTQNPGSLLPMAYALSNKKIINQGVASSGLAIGPTGLELLDAVNSRDIWLNTRFEAQRTRFYQGLMQRVHQEKVTGYTDLGNTFQNSFASQTTDTDFDDSSLTESEDLSAKFQAIAKTIAMRDTFGIKRQTFFISFGNFDGHTDLLVRQERLLKEVDLAMKNFWDEMCAQGLEDKVTVFTGSDFGRTLRSNGAGTDHAWGGNALVMGGAVNGSATTGGKIVGQYPTSLLLGQGLDTGTNGRLLPTTSIDSYYADLLSWFGVQESDLPSILPNIGNFSTEPDLGIFDDPV